MNDLVNQDEQQLPSLAPIVQLVASKQINPEQLKELLEIQREHDADLAKKAYHHAMAEFRKRVPKIEKDSVVDFTSSKGRTNYRHASLANTLNTINGLLGELGLNPSFITDDSDPSMIRITCVLTHKDGHSTENAMGGPPDTSGNKNLLQARSSTVTYLQRYTLFSILGLASSDDNDGADGAQQYDVQQEKPQIPDDKFKEWYEDFKQRVTDGKVTAKAVHKQLKIKYTLTESQDKDLKGLSDCEPVK